MWKEMLLLIAGLSILVTGGELLVRGATNIALRMRISSLVVGLTIVAFGTSAPELFVSIQSALAGSPDLTMGNVIGSNICNLALVLGITALIFPVKVQDDSIKIDWPMTMGSSVLLYLLVRENLITSYEGVLFIFILAAYTVFIIWKSRRENNIPKPVAEDPEGLPLPAPILWKNILFIVVGTVGLALGSDWLVGGAQAIALEFGVSERIIGITLLAVGTSLPELVTSVVASFRKETDIAVGNLMGSNIFNILSILGITSIIQEIQVSDVIINSDMIWMLIITFLIFPMMLHKREVGRLEGLILLGIYVYYLYNVISSPG
jgi:cation:H+ antiporter